MQAVEAYVLTQCQEVGVLLLYQKIPGREGTLPISLKR